VANSQELTDVQLDEEFNMEQDFNHTNQVRNTIIQEESSLSGTGNVLVDRLVHYRVSTGSDALASTFQNALSSHFYRSQSKTRINYAVVDAIVENDYKSSIRGKEIVVYIFNSFKQGTQDNTYHYYSSDTSTCGGSSQLGKASFTLQAPWCFLTGDYHWSIILTWIAFICGCAMIHIQLDSNTLDTSYWIMIIL
jgi:hypothetical protein